jgi:predicted benzoate:H+ symporter BenE
MLWLIGSGLILLWLVLQIFAPRGWVPMLLIAGVSLLIIQTAAYRKQKAIDKHR